MHQVEYFWITKFKVFIILKCLQIPFCVFIILIEITLITLRRKYDKSTLVKIIACSMTATNLYPSQCWPRSVSLNDATRPHRVKEHQIKPDKICFVQVHKSTAVTLPCSVQHVGNIFFYWNWCVRAPEIVPPVDLFSGVWPWKRISTC